MALTLMREIEVLGPLASHNFVPKAQYNLLNIL
jgi:hypothetical protein